MLDDERAVSTVIGEVMMIAVVIVIAAVLAGYASELLQSSLKVNSVNILIEGARADSNRVTIVHMGGDTISNAFRPTDERFLNASICENLEIRINGAIYNGSATLNRGPISKANFGMADEVELLLAPGSELKTGDSISVVFLPSDQVLRWTVVV